MIIRNISTAFRGKQKIKIGTTGYLINTRRHVQDQSKNAFKPLTRGPNNGPGPSEREMHGDDQNLKPAQYHLESRTPRHYMFLSVDAVINNGFIIQGREIMGTPIALLQDTVLAWNVNSPHQITADSLALFYTTLPKVEILIVGTGEKTAFIDPREIEKLQKRGLKVETMKTEKAAGTFNLLRYDRTVGLAMMPIIPDDKHKIKAEKNKRTVESLIDTDSFANTNRYGLNYNDLKKIESRPQFLKPPYLYYTDPVTGKEIKPDFNLNPTYQMQYDKKERPLEYTDRPKRSITEILESTKLHQGADNFKTVVDKLDDTVKGDKIDK